MKFHSEIEENLWSMVAFCRNKGNPKIHKFVMLIYFYHNDLSDKYHLEHAAEALEFLNSLDDEKIGIPEIKKNLRPKIEMWIPQNNELEL